MITSKTEKRLKALISPDVKNSRYYKALTKRIFRQTPGYVDYKSVVFDMASLLVTAKAGVMSRGLDGQDPAYVAMLLSSYTAWTQPNFPVYAITPDLAQAFLQTETPSHVCSIKQLFLHALFLVPSRLIKNPDGKFCTWIYVTHLWPGDYYKYEPGYKDFIQNQLRLRIPVSPGITLHDHKLQWATTLDSNYIYGNVMELPSGGDRVVRGEFVGNSLSVLDNLEEEDKFAKTIDSLILQTMLYMQIPQKKQLLIPSSKETATHQARGFGAQAQQEPIWIGSDYRQQIIKKTHQGGTHASPITHWRTGHWRFIPVSRGATETKPVFVRPTIVNG